MRIAREEIFSPVLVIVLFKDEVDAMSIANDSFYLLAVYIPTEDPERARRVVSKSQAGAIHINDGGIDYGTPFAG